MKANTVSLKNNPIKKINIVLEDAIVTFFITLLPKLIELGRPPANINEIWTPLLSSILMALYSYMRLRGITKE